MNLSQNRFTSRRLRWASLIFVTLLAFEKSAWSASDLPVASPATDAVAPSAQPKAPPPEAKKEKEQEKPVLPGKYELADSAFKKLDPTKKGYVEKGDIKGLEGFDVIFDEVDSKHTGMLDHSQFVIAWKQYLAGKIL